MSDPIDEKWAPIAGYPHYIVSDQGCVKSLPRVISGKRSAQRIPGKILKPSLNKGYPCLSLCFEGACKVHFVHQLVARAFIGDPMPGFEVCHVNGKRDDPRLANLRYGTRADNIADAKMHGTFPVMEDRPGARLTRDQAAAIAASDKTAQELADEYGVSFGAITGIRSGLNWSSVTTLKADYRRRGENHKRSKLTAEMVREILSTYKKSKELGEKFGVDRTTIQAVRRRKNWKHFVL